MTVEVKVVVDAVRVVVAATWLVAVEVGLLVLVLVTVVLGVGMRRQLQAVEIWALRKLVRAGGMGSPAWRLAAVGFAVQVKTVWVVVVVLDSYQQRSY